MTERSKIAVETVYGNYTSLTLVEKNVVGLDNSFYFQIFVLNSLNIHTDTPLRSDKRTACHPFSDVEYSRLSRCNGRCFRLKMYQ